MNYPVWEPAVLGGSTLIALISIIHVYIAHFAVGGGLFIWLTDLKAFREKDPLLDGYLRRHNAFFLLLTMVLGGVTGVGIWFIIGLVSPAATSVLIHRFFFAFAAEWTFFIGEITALLIYHYYFDTLDRRHRLRIAFFYFIFAFLSLVAINGVVSFMLTPGKWPVTGSFWDGMLNPTFLPSTAFRSFAAFMLAGLFGYVTVVTMQESLFRARMMRYCTRWLLYPMAGLVVSGAWYYYSVPPSYRVITFSVNPETAPYVHVLFACSVLIFIAGLALSLRSGPRIQRCITAVLVAIGLLWMGGFEYIREIGRKPYVINEYMYSNSILKSEAAALAREGVLARARWSSVRRITPENRHAAGGEILRLLCLSCHTVGGMKNDLAVRTRGLTRLGMNAELTGMGRAKSYMPPFMGNEAEREALAAYIVEKLHGAPTVETPNEFRITPIADPPLPPGEAGKGRRVLLSWDETGMRFFTDNDRWLSIIPPGGTLRAILIRRGDPPEIVRSGVDVRYRVESRFENPSRHAPFTASGTFFFDENTGVHTAAGVFVPPCDAHGVFNPYPLFTVEAGESEKVLISVKAVANASTEMGCRNCHGGPWRVKNASGMSDETARNILTLHDRSNGTRLLTGARRGQPARCASCHADPSVKSAGRPGRLNLSAAIHGFHAHYMPRKGAAACALCHPVHPAGATRAFRGVHRLAGLDCTACHGGMNEHAVSLLRGETSKKRGMILLRAFGPEAAVKNETIRPRAPWINEPQCLSCHVDFGKPVKGSSAFNRWTKDESELFKNSADTMGIPCAACHNGAHAEYPAVNPYNPRRDVLQPLRYMNSALAIGADGKCTVCHTSPPGESAHHDNMLRRARIRIMTR